MFIMSNLKLLFISLSELQDQSICFCVRHFYASLTQESVTHSDVCFSLCLTMLSVMRLFSVDDRMINGYGTAGGMRIGREDQSTQRKPTSVPLCPQQIPRSLIRGGIWGPALGILTCELNKNSMEIPACPFEYVHF
jgi:hypothetical protein